MLIFFREMLVLLKDAFFNGGEMAEAENPAQSLIDEEFPIGLRPLVAPALKRAYQAADSLILRTEFLDNPSGRYQRGDLICKAAEHEFRRLIEAGSLPFEPSWDDYASPTGKHLVMRGKRSRITINQVDKPNTKPRRAAFRVNFGESNMADLFPEQNRAIREENEKKHIVLLHGHRNLTFATLGLPHPTRAKLIWRTPNLLPKVFEVADIPPGTTSPVPPEEGPTQSPDPEALENLLRLIRDNS
ncbi:hypothetical protein [Methylobacterium sp. Leaf94]|uniref:hypothetical protein n=1 Tax=Methylobacterium sp. Leaf94 TaxID=1736250 RepID=UPI000A8C6469|nr:hypothetical protein [Methylobacterium sp. Leaf94]